MEADNCGLRLRETANMLAAVKDKVKRGNLKHSKISKRCL